MAEAVAEEYRSSLSDLNFNSKPHINMLTMLAEENVKHAPLIVDAIVSHIKTVSSDLKLPSLYLVDSIMKNIGGQYITLFSKHMITLFSSVFEKVEEATRSALYKLRQTWNDILPKEILYGIDFTVNQIDPAWPITAAVPASKSMALSKSPIHVNPKFLGGSTAQGNNSAKSSAKTVPAPKNEAKEVVEIKKRQEEMLRLIEEKKMQLKALEQKKLEMAAEQKKKLILGANVLHHPSIQKKPLNHRDPRLKKGLTVVPPTPTDKFSSTLQSVVVVPNTKLPPDCMLDNNVGDLKSLTKLNVDNEKHITDAPQKKLHLDHKNGNLHQKETKSLECKEKPALNNREHLSRNCRNPNKKHPISPEKNSHLGTNAAKKMCKPVNKLKRPVSQEDSLQGAKSEPHPVKKGKQEISKSKNRLGNDIRSGDYATLVPNVTLKKENGKMLPGDKRLSEQSVLFGTEDKDYRQHMLIADSSKSKQWNHDENVHPPNSRHIEGFYPTKGNMFLNDATTHNLAQRKPVDEKYQSTTIPEYDQQLINSEKFRHIEHLNKTKDPNDNPPKVLVKTEILDDDYHLKTPSLLRERLPPSSKKTLMLDGKNRTIYFVNERALAIMDNNEPRELTFIGPPRNVYVEGLSQPLVLGFEKRSFEFEMDGKKNSIHFGTPSREVYINNFPYEAQFGGPPFVVLLEDKKEHRVRVDGPPPQVVISKTPAYELLDKLNQTKRISPLPQIPDQNVNNKEPGSASHDVDMRLKPSHVMKSSILPLPESRKDVDWRHVPLADGSQIPWKNSGGASDVPGITNRNYSVALNNSMEPNSLTQWEDSKGGIGIHGEHGIPERNQDINKSQWPHPGFREAMTLGERPPLHMNQKGLPAPPATWEMQQAPLPPPPSIPPALNLPPPPNLPSLSSLPAPPHLPNLSTLQLPNLNVPPPSWNPLPPPPMFSGTVPDGLNNAALPSSTGAHMSSSSIMSESAVSVVPSLPINVETIYEKLVAAGFISKKTEEDTSNVEISLDDIKKEPEEEEVEPEILLTPKSLREYRPRVIVHFYKGSQCATCGMRFKEIQSEQYSRHLDWHFRMNRREKDGAKKAFSRRFYFGIQDWIDFREIEDVEERAPSYFELQADGETSKSEEPEKIQSVPASGDRETEKCSVCGEQFQLFWVEEEEEWHLRHAVRHDGEAYHPMCYEDFKKVSEKDSKEADAREENSLKEEPEEEPDTMEIIETVTVKKEQSESEEFIQKEETCESKEFIQKEETCESEELIRKEETRETEEFIQREETCESEEIVETETSESEQIAKNASSESEQIPEKESSLPPAEPTTEDVAGKQTELPNAPSVDDNKETNSEVGEDKMEDASKENVEESVAGKEINKAQEEAVEESPTEKVVDGEKEEEMEVSDGEKQSKNDIPDLSADADMEVDGVDKEEATVVEAMEEAPKEANPVEAPKVPEGKIPSVSTDTDLDNTEEEFRPPTPDPRFQVLSPVFRGTELSALCTIM